MKIHTLFAIAVLLLPAAASAQSFNVDMKAIVGAPSATFGAAALQPGSWNPVGASALGAPVSLVNIAGIAGPVTLTLTAGAHGPGWFNNTGTFGDDGLLMDDYMDPSPGPTTYTIAGLAPGTYDVITYAWAPDFVGWVSGVSVNGSAVTTVGGSWPGTYVHGVTHAKHTVTILAGGTITITLTAVSSYASFNGFQLKRLPTPSTAVCDGSVQALCPCSNSGAAGRGCANSSFAAGTELVTSGVASLSSDTLVLTTNDMPGPGAFFQASGGSSFFFGDGLLCASVGLIRLGTVFPNATFHASYPGGLTPNPISIAGAPIAQGDTKVYQVWYRDSGAFCTPSTFNLSNGRVLTWAP